MLIGNLKEIKRRRVHCGKFVRPNKVNEPAAEQVIGPTQ